MENEGVAAAECDRDMVTLCLDSALGTQIVFPAKLVLMLIWPGRKFYLFSVNPFFGSFLASF